MMIPIHKLGIPRKTRLFFCKVLILLSFSAVLKLENCLKSCNLLLGKQTNPILKNSFMDKLLIKKIQTQLSHYFSDVSQMTKAETRCLKDMVLGILKSKSVFINQIASSLREPLKLKNLAKRLSSQYLKDDFAKNVLESHLHSVGSGISKNDFILMDGTDISKKHAKYMEGLEFVRNGDTGQTGLGYNVLNINAVNIHKETTPLYSKAYSYQMGALSSNKEIKKAVLAVRSHIDDKGCWVFDRGADNTILKDFFTQQCGQCLIRLKRNSMLNHKGEELRVSQIEQRIEYIVSQQVTKIKKHKPVVKTYNLAAAKVVYTTAKGKQIPLWLVISRSKQHGGLCYLLVKSNLCNAIEVAQWAFKGYGLRWKIEEYHRHMKQEYRLEDVQIKTFNGIQSMLAILTVTMYIIYNKIKSMHLELLLNANYNYLNKHIPRELVNFIYYKISKVVSNLLIPVRIRWKIQKDEPEKYPGQLNLMFN